MKHSETILKNLNKINEFSDYGEFEVVYSNLEEPFEQYQLLVDMDDGKKYFIEISRVVEEQKINLPPTRIKSKFIINDNWWEMNVWNQENNLSFHTKSSTPEMLSEILTFWLSKM